MQPELKAQLVETGTSMLANLIRRAGNKVSTKVTEIIESPPVKPPEPVRHAIIQPVEPITTATPPTGSVARAGLGLPLGVLFEAHGRGCGSSP